MNTVTCKTIATATASVKVKPAVTEGLEGLTTLIVESGACWLQTYMTAQEAQALVNLLLASIDQTQEVAA